MKKIVLLGIITLFLIFGCTNEEQAPFSKEIVTQQDQPITPREDDLVEEKNTIVLIETTKGDMKVKLFDSSVPITTDNFKKLVKEGFYDGTIFHRVIKDFMVQGGDPEGNGTGGPGYNIKDEFVKELRHNKRGLLSMANSGPNTGGSQFFITLVPTPWLDDKHAIFGEIIEGQDVLDTIGSTETDSGDRPIDEIKVIKMSVVE